MRALTAAGHEFDCFEATDRIGGHWHTDYDNLHLITPRAGSGFHGDPMPDEWAHFLRRSQMVQYLEGHADRFDLRSRVTFNTRVERLVPIGPKALDGWEVTTSDAATRRYSGVLVANGHNSVPSVPTVPGTFSGKILHSGEYHNPGDIEGRRVLVQHEAVRDRSLVIEAIRVTVLMPGRVQTRLYDGVFGDNDAASAALYDGFEAIQPADIAAVIGAAIDLPAHVDLTTIEILPTAQVFGGSRVASGHTAGTTGRGS